MKKQVLFVFMLFLAFSLPAMAQNKDPKMEARIQLARDKYAEGKDLVAQNEDKETPFNYATVVRKQNWPATGHAPRKRSSTTTKSGTKKSLTLRAMRFVWCATPITWPHATIMRSIFMTTMDGRCFIIRNTMKSTRIIRAKPSCGNIMMKRAKSSTPSTRPRIRMVRCRKSVRIATPKWWRAASLCCVLFPITSPISRRCLMQYITIPTNKL